jgi:hypothetical protein
LIKTTIVPRGGIDCAPVSVDGAGKRECNRVDLIHCRRGAE